MARSKKLKCESGTKSNLGNFCLLVQGKGESCEKKGCCIGCDEIESCKRPCGVALDEAGIKPKKKNNNHVHEEALEKHKTESEAALEVVNMEKLQEGSKEQEHAEREAKIAEVHEVIGRIQGFKLITEFADVGSLVWLKQVKESKIYKDLPNIGTWDKFCERVGLSRSKVDEDLKNLATFGERFLADVGNFSLGYRDLRKLRKLSSEGTLQIEGNTLRIGGEEIPLDDKEELAAAIEKVIEEKDQHIEEQAAAVKTKDRLLKAKEDVIHKMEKEIKRLEKHVDISDLSPEEQEAIDLLSTFQGEFQKMIETVRKKVPFDGAPTVALRQLYFLYIFISKIALEERMDLYNHYEGADECPWEIMEEEVPEAGLMIDNLPLTAGKGLGKKVRAKTEGKA